MERKLSTFYSDHGKGYAEIYFDFKEEHPFIRYYTNEGKLYYTEDFKEKTLRYVEDAAENWALGIKKLENSYH